MTPSDGLAAELRRLADVHERKGRYMTTVFALRSAAAELERSQADPPEVIARRLHERDASAVPWDEVPEANRALMVATVRAVLGSTQ